MKAMESSIVTLAAILALLLAVSSCKGSKKTVVAPPDVTVVPPPGTFTPQPDLPPPPETGEGGNRYAFADSLLVRKAQILLYLHGYETGRVNGKLSESTKAALLEFERQLGGNADGKEVFKQVGVYLMDFEVSDLQTALDGKNYDPGPIDNFVGPMTRTAYGEFLLANNLPLDKFTAATKTALFSKDAKYMKPAASDDGLLGADTSPLPQVVDFVPQSKASQADVGEVRRALWARGYDPGPEGEGMTPQLEDAVYKFQLDRKLPLGGLNPDTLRALGFGD